MVGFFIRVSLLNSGSWIEHRHVRLFDKMVQYHQTTRRFAKFLNLSFNFMCHLYLGPVTFSKKLKVAESTGWIVETLLDVSLSAPIYSLCTKISALQSLIANEIGQHADRFDVSFYNLFSMIPFEYFLTPYQNCEDRARPKVPRIILPPRQIREKNIKMNEGRSNSQKKIIQEPQPGEKGNSKRSSFNKKISSQGFSIHHEPWDFMKVYIFFFHIGPWKTLV